MTTMYDAAVAWVERHRAACSGDPCGCRNVDTETMVDGLLEYWLSDSTTPDNTDCPTCGAGEGRPIPADPCVVCAARIDGARDAADEIERLRAELDAQYKGETW